MSTGMRLGKMNPSETINEDDVNKRFPFFKFYDQNGNEYPKGQCFAKLGEIFRFVKFYDKNMMIKKVHIIDNEKHPSKYFDKEYFDIFLLSLCTSDIVNVTHHEKMKIFKLFCRYKNDKLIRHLINIFELSKDDIAHGISNNHYSHYRRRRYRHSHSHTYKRCCCHSHSCEYEEYDSYVYSPTNSEIYNESSDISSGYSDISVPTTSSSISSYPSNSDCSSYNYNYNY